jgi:hypothetical protein
MIIAFNWLQLYIDMAQNAEAVVELLDMTCIEIKKNMLISYNNV